MADGVNLDALILRVDFADEGTPPTGNQDTRINMSHLAGDSHWVQSLRKPDFQRETTNWTPKKIVDLIAAYLDGDLIPAIILWRSGHLAFVIDGAHRLSAMLAWIYDDYGQGIRSLKQFENQIPEEQLKLAEQTRKLVNEQIGPYSQYREIWSNLHDSPAPPALQKRLGNFQHNGFVAQWVPAVDADGAQNAFFKINQAQTPIDPVEQKILLNRRSASAISTRAIHRGGAGHRYWAGFDKKIREEIESLGKDINSALYLPALGGAAIKTSDVPIAGRGYSALPFTFDLVNLTNDVPTNAKPKKSTRNADEDVEEADVVEDVDADGKQTVQYLKTLNKKLRRITTDDAASLGLHPLVYFYTRGGKFQPNTFLAILPVIERLVAEKKLEAFCEIREKFEAFILKHKEAFTLIVKRQGAGQKSRPSIGKFLELVMQGFWDGKTEAQIVDELGQDGRFYQIARPAPIRGRGGNDKGFSSSTKAAAFVEELSKSGVRCGICGAMVHRNSMQMDHVKPKREGGSNAPSNATVAHPFCNSTYKDWKAKGGKRSQKS